VPNFYRGLLTLFIPVTQLVHSKKHKIMARCLSSISLNIVRNDSTAEFWICLQNYNRFL